MNLRQAAQHALKVMDDHMYRADTHEFYEAKEALRAALAEPEQNPFGDDAERYAHKLHQERESYKNIFTAPTPRRPLTDEEIVDIWAGVSMDYDDEINIIELARAIERAHGIGEQHGS